MDDLDEPDSPFRVFCYQSAEKRLCISPDNGNRCPKFMRDIGDEILADLFKALEVGYVVEYRYDSPKLSMFKQGDPVGQDGLLPGRLDRRFLDMLTPVPNDEPERVVEGRMSADLYERLACDLFPDAEHGAEGRVGKGYRP